MLELKKPSVSVIVPVYNVEPFLRRCVDSLRSQTLTDIEILLIDDGSTDGSGSICDVYASADPRIRTVHQKNAGLSAARNTGIDLAGAEHLMFVDGDDWVEPDFCRLPLAAAKEHRADLVMFLSRFYRDGREQTRRHPEGGGLQTEAQAIRLMLGGVGVAAWNKLYHRTLFDENRYPEGKVYEDTFLTPLLIRRAVGIVYLPATLYNQAYRKGSITTDRSAKNARDWYESVSLTAGRLREWGYEAEADEYYRGKLLRFLQNGWNCPELNRRFLRDLRARRGCPPGLSARGRLGYRLLLMSPQLYRLACRLRSRIFG